MPLLTGVLLISTAVLKAGKAKLLKKCLPVLVSLTAQLDFEIVRMIRSWRNSDADAFRQKMEELIRDCKELQNCVQQYCDLMDRSITEYEQTQAAAKQGAGNLASPKGR